MEKHITKKKNERSFILLGFASITILFLLYSRIQDLLVTPEMIESLERLAAGFYLLLLISFGSIAYLAPFGVWANFNVKCFDSDLDNYIKA